MMFLRLEITQWHSSILYTDTSKMSENSVCGFGVGVFGLGVRVLWFRCFDFLNGHFQVVPELFHTIVSLVLVVTHSVSSGCQQ